MSQNKVKLFIAGVQYSILADDDELYVKQLASEVDHSISKMMKENTSTSLNQACVLTALEYADQAKKETTTADHLREQIKDYLDDASNAKNKADKFKRDLEKAHRDLENANNEIERLKIQVSTILEKTGNN